MNNVMLTFISFDDYLLSNCWLVSVLRGGGGGGSWFIGDVNFRLKCSYAESLNRVYQYFRV